MRLAPALAFAGEAKGLAVALREENAATAAAPVVVSGVLAEQLAKQLAVEAAPGAVLVHGGGSLGVAEVLVHVVAGDPSDSDEALVREAHTLGIGVVLVELWPQPDWTRPFVLTPFVVECKAGEGFPIRDIADRIVEATENSSTLAAQVPVLAEAARARLVKQSAIRSGLLALVGAASRPVLSLEQVRMASRLRTASAEPGVSEELPVLAGRAAAVFASGFALRQLARSGRTVLPDPVVDAAVAAAGTWALGKALQAVESRLHFE